MKNDLLDGQCGQCRNVGVKCKGCGRTKKHFELAAKNSKRNKKRKETLERRINPLGGLNDWLIWSCRKDNIMGLFRALVDVVSMPLRVAVDVVKMPVQIAKGENALENTIKGIKKIEEDLED